MIEIILRRHRCKARLFTSSSGRRLMMPLPAKAPALCSKEVYRPLMS